MAVTIVTGDLLQASENIIGHQVNCQGVMSSGVAKPIRAQFPEAYKAYIARSQGAKPERLLGQCQLVDTARGQRIANLFGQLQYGRSQTVYTNYEALRQALSQLKELAQRDGLTVALPYNIGCGLANGDWGIVEPMIAEVFDDYAVTLYKLN